MLVGQPAKSKLDESRTGSGFADGGRVPFVDRLPHDREDRSRRFVFPECNRFFDSLVWLNGTEHETHFRFSDSEQRSRFRSEQGFLHGDGKIAMRNDMNAVFRSAEVFNNMLLGIVGVRDHGAGRSKRGASVMP